MVLTRKQEYRREYYKKNKEIEAKKKKEWVIKNKEKVKLTWHKWYKKNKNGLQMKRQTNKIKEIRNEQQKGYVKRNPEKIKAHSLSRKIKLQEKCQDCGKKATEKHHEDYSKPEEVVFLCKECHTRRH